MRRHLRPWIVTLALAAFAPVAPLDAAVGDGATLHLGLGRGNPTVRFEYGHARRAEPRRVWIPGHCETRCERVWVPGRTRQEWLPPRYEWRIDACGRRFQVLVEPGRWITVAEPGRYETREVSVWVPGHWSHERR